VELLEGFVISWGGILWGMIYWSFN